MKKIKSVINRLKKIMVYILNQKIFRHISDEKFIKIKFRLLMNEKLQLNNPKTFNEKLQWLKLYNRNEEYVRMVDKYEAKKYVGSKIGEEYIIPTLQIAEKFEQIEFNKLPTKFVMKATHTSGNVLICKEKKNLDIANVKKEVNRWLKREYFYLHREWPYKNVKPRIIIEQYMESYTDSELKDYKLFCFNGNVETILVCSNRKGKFKNTDFYDINWNLLPFTRELHLNNPNGIERPENLEEMLTIAKKLSAGIPFVRVDLYEINGRTYFGELTFFPSAGFEGFNPREYDLYLGEILKLPDNVIKEKK